jgi:hypothetical protein
MKSKQLALITALFCTYMEPLSCVSRGKSGETDTGKTDYRHRARTGRGDNRWLSTGGRVCDHRGYERMSYRWPLNRLATASDASPTQMCPSSRPPRAHGPHLRPATHCETVSTFSHFEMSVVSGGILGLLASWKPLPSLSLTACPAAESPSHAAYFSAPTAQRGIVFAPSALMTQSSTGKTPCVVGR